MKIKKQGTQKVCHEKKTVQDYKNCLETAQTKNKINHLEKYIIDVESRKEDKIEFIKTIKLILKTQQRFKSEKYIVFTEEINKIALSSNDDKRMQSTDSIETYAYGTSEDLRSEKEEIKCNNIRKQYKK